MLEILAKARRPKEKKKGGGEGTLKFSVSESKN